MIWIFTWSEEPKIKSKKASKRDRTCIKLYFNAQCPPAPWFLRPCRRFIHRGRQSARVTRLEKKKAYRGNSVHSVVISRFFFELENAHESFNLGTFLYHLFKKIFPNCVTSIFMSLFFLTFIWRIARIYLFASTGIACT